MNLLLRQRILIVLIIEVCIFLMFNHLSAQLYSTAYQGGSFGNVTVIHPNCSYEFFGMASGVLNSGITMTPESLFINLNDANEWTLQIIDQVTGNITTYFEIPEPSLVPIWGGLVSIGNGIFYSIHLPDNSLYEINVNTGIITFLGIVPYYNGNGDLTLFDGEIYYPWLTLNETILNGIVQLNVSDPSQSELVVDLQGTNIYFAGLSASTICNTLIAAELNFDELLYVNLIDGVITPICQSPNTFYLTSLIEFESPTICEVYLDLDQDDSSGATNADYISEEFDCHSNGVYVSDQDITLLYDALITEMTVEITGAIPDAPYEILFSTGPVQNIDVGGDGTSMITLSNAGSAKSTDFREALRRIKYDNTSILPTAGTRTVEVQFTTESGAMSNIATAFIEVIELPSVDVDLGDDTLICDGETATFDAGNPGADYEWSTGDDTQTITVDQPGEYIVTVSDGVNCPNQDTVELEVLSVIHVSLTGDESGCDNEPVDLIVTTDGAFPLDVEISVVPGTPILLEDIMGTFIFNDLPSQSVEYLITNVIPSQPACIELSDPYQGIEIYPSYQHTFDASICEGDSLWLGYYWETEAGTYEYTFASINGCDSVVTINLSIVQTIMISEQGSSCHSADTGVFITMLPNPNGCDTMLETTISLILADTTHLAGTTCQSANSGIFIQVMQNQNGCDSVIITTVVADPPQDTTLLEAMTCDSAAVEITHNILMNIQGCDSLIITDTQLAPPDTSYAFGQSCDVSEIGVSEQLFATTEGCDSLVITTITPGTGDTTNVFTTSCDSSSLGVFEELFQNQNECDSLVITTVEYSASDSTFLFERTCDETQSSIFVDAFINRFGCDSIVTETITWIPSAETHLTSTTCEESQAGVFIDTLTGHLGCDSIVINTIDLLPSDDTFLTNTTCDPSHAGMFITTHFNQYGCDSTVTLTVALVESDTTELTEFTCDPSQVSSQETLLTGQDGCDSLVIESTVLYPLPDLNIEVTSDFNGYAISCAGAGDGSMTASIAGVSPFTFFWSTGDTDQSISGLSAGTYHVTITDGNGCESVDEITLTEPPEFSIGFIVSQPDCFDGQAGSIEVDQQGGIEPIRYSIDGINFQASPLFENLSGGTYEITAFDANDCEVKEIIWLNVPLQVNVELGDNMIIIPGDTVVIEAIVNVPYDSIATIFWTGLTNPDCPNCLTQPVVPIITTTYSVTVSTHDGCTDEDEMTLFLERNHDIFIPNIFTPNGDGINDEIMISGGRDVKRIITFSIYDRWGNVVFEGKDFAPGNETIAWDGTFRNEGVNPGVFAYRVIVELEGEGSVVRYGDITLMR
jgi:gliding motility-associated-like protein